MLEIVPITDPKYGLTNHPYRVYPVPEGEGLDDYVLKEWQPLSEGNNPIAFLELAKNPATRKYVPYRIYYDAEKYSDEDIYNIPTLGKVGQTCSYCQARNNSEEMIQQLEANKKKLPGADIVREMQHPVGTPATLDLGNVITPSVIPAAVDVFSQIFCQPLGVALIKISAAGLASIAAGWAKEGGTQEAWRKISEDLIREYKICPADIPELQRNVMAIKNGMDKDRKNILGALMAGTVKNFKDVAKEHGFEVSASANVKGRAEVAIAPLSRGGGRAID
jgi:hypothetical protein